jgi:hypothetical protein
MCPRRSGGGRSSGGRRDGANILRHPPQPRRGQPQHPRLAPANPLRRRLLGKHTAQALDDRQQTGDDFAEGIGTGGHGRSMRKRGRLGKYSFRGRAGVRRKVGEGAPLDPPGFMLGGGGPKPRSFRGVDRRRFSCGRRAMDSIVARTTVGSALRWRLSSRRGKFAGGLKPTPQSPSAAARDLTPKFVE